MTRRIQKKPPPGFPWKGKFKTKEEVDSYYAGEKIQCLLCGKWFRQVHEMHLKRIHRISSDDYREMYGLPWRRGLIGTLCRQKKSENAKRMIAEGKLLKLTDEFRGNGLPRRPHQPYERNHIVNAGLAEKGKIVQYRHEGYERILERMRIESRSLTDVCGDPDMPSTGAWKNYVNTKHPELKEQVHQIHHSLPYSLQAMCRDISPRFSIDCQRLFARGETTLDIAAALNTPASLVNRELGKVLPDFGRLKPLINYRKVRFEDYEAVVERIRDQHRTLIDVCNDPDLPSISSVRRFIKENPEFENKIRKIRHRLPYHTQSKLGMLSPRFTIDCLRLRAKGYGMEKIVKALGCSISNVKRVLRDNPISGLPDRLKGRKNLQRKDYEAIFGRMRSQQRTLRDVCNDKGFPSFESWMKYKKKHPEIEEEYQRVLWSLPIQVQMKTHTVSPELLPRLQRMRSRGMSKKEIAEDLGVSKSAVEKLIVRIRLKKKRETGKK